MFPYLIPEAGRHHFVDARISQYGKLVIFYSKVEQYAVTRFRARYAQNTEDFTRAFRQRFPRMAFQVNLDFAGRLFSASRIAWRICCFSMTVKKSLAIDQNCTSGTCSASGAASKYPRSWNPYIPARMFRGNCFK